MPTAPSRAADALVLLAATLTVAGTWLPWVSKRPVRYVDGVPYTTDEYVLGMETGLHGMDFVVVLLAVGALGATALSRNRRVNSHWVALVAGTLLLWSHGRTLLEFRAVERYAVEPGLYLAVAGGLLFVLVGLRAPVAHLRGSGA